MNILVCDDREEHCDSLVEMISRTFVEGTVTPLSATNLSTALDTFFQSIEAFLKNKPHSTPVEGIQRFDDADLIVIDNNLTHLNLSGPRLTGESIAGYIRAFSAGPYIISVNKNPDVDFDLRFLIGDYNTRADLALNEDHLGSRALWTGNPSDAEDGFLPWYWPRLKDVVDRRQKQIKLCSRAVGPGSIVLARF